MDRQRRELERRAVLGDFDASVRLGVLDMRMYGEAIYGPFWSDDTEYIAKLEAISPDDRYYDICNGYHLSFILDSGFKFPSYCYETILDGYQTSGLCLQSGTYTDYYGIELEPLDVVRRWVAGVLAIKL